MQQFPGIQSFVPLDTLQSAMACMNVELKNGIDQRNAQAAYIVQLESQVMNQQKQLIETQQTILYFNQVLQQYKSVIEQQSHELLQIPSQDKSSLQIQESSESAKPISKTNFKSQISPQLEVTRITYYECVPDSEPTKKQLSSSLISSIDVIGEALTSCSCSSSSSSTNTTAASFASQSMCVKQSVECQTDFEKTKQSVDCQTDFQHKDWMSFTEKIKILKTLETKQSEQNKILHNMRLEVEDGKQWRKKHNILHQELQEITKLHKSELAVLQKQKSEAETEKARCLDVANESQKQYAELQKWRTQIKQQHEQMKMLVAAAVATPDEKQSEKYTKILDELAKTMRPDQFEEVKNRFLMSDQNFNSNESIIRHVRDWMSERVVGIFYLQQMVELFFQKQMAFHHITLQMCTNRVVNFASDETSENTANGSPSDDLMRRSVKRIRVYLTKLLALRSSSSSSSSTSISTLSTSNSNSNNNPKKSVAMKTKFPDESLKPNHNFKSQTSTTSNYISMNHLSVDLLSAALLDMTLLYEEQLDTMSLFQKSFQSKFQMYLQSIHTTQFKLFQLYTHTKSTNNMCSTSMENFVTPNQTPSLTKDCFNPVSSSDFQMPEFYSLFVETFESMKRTFD